MILRRSIQPRLLKLLFCLCLMLPQCTESLCFCLSSNDARSAKRFTTKPSPSSPSSSSLNSLPSSRRAFFGVGAAAATLFVLDHGAGDTPLLQPIVAATTAHAAPPIAIIAEELGYFPATNRNGETIYVPANVKRQSTDQAVRLAKYLTQHGVTMTGTYWCPHTSRQKELFGAQAFRELQYVECAPKGYQGNPSYCATRQVDGYPSWIFSSNNSKNKPNSVLPGEQTLATLATAVGFQGFDETLELGSNPPALVGSSCK